MKGYAPTTCGGRAVASDSSRNGRARGGKAVSGGEGYLTGASRQGRGSGGWVGFDTQVAFGPTGLGLTSSVLHDIEGPVGRAQQMLTVRPFRDLT